MHSDHRHENGLADRRRWFSRGRVGGLVVIAAGLVWVLLQARTAQAATIVVDRTDDDASASACTASPNDCSLRGAFIYAGANPGPDTITLPAGTYTLTLAGSNENSSADGDLDVLEDLTLNGAGSGTTIIDGNGAVTGERVLDIRGGTPVVVINDVTLTGGQESGTGGGIQSAGDLTITNSVIESNTAGLAGGGIINAGDLILDNVTVTSNQSDLHGGGIHHSTGFLHIINSEISHNQALDPSQAGGGLYQDGGALLISDSFFEFNEAEMGGGIAVASIGGVWNLLRVRVGSNNAGPGEGAGLYWDNSGTGYINKSQFQDNHAAGGGGGIYLGEGKLVLAQTTLLDNRESGASSLGGGGIYNKAELELINSTLSGNEAFHDGGGIYNAAGSPTVLLTNSTLANNVAGFGGTPGATGGGLYAETGTVTMVNTIIAGNTNGECDATTGTFISNGHNLSGDSSCSLTAMGDLPNTPAGLAPLAFNGGWSSTHALLPGSPALDAGDPGSCPAYDQRQVSRPQGLQCDIGAFEQDLLLNLFLPLISK